MPRKPYIINATALLILVLAVAGLDAGLELGDFSGLVFSLYLAYASGLLLIVNLVAAVALHRKGRKRMRDSTIAAGLFFSALGFVISWLPSVLVQ